VYKITHTFTLPLSTRWKAHRLRPASTQACFCSDTRPPDRSGPDRSTPLRVVVVPSKASHSPNGQRPHTTHPRPSMTAVMRAYVSASRPLEDGDQPFPRPCLVTTRPGGLASSSRGQRRLSAGRLVGRGPQSRWLGKGSGEATCERSSPRAEGRGWRSQGTTESFICLARGRCQREPPPVDTIGPPLMLGKREASRSRLGLDGPGLTKVAHIKRDGLDPAE
jgi:hypothetical protein